MFALLRFVLRQELGDGGLQRRALAGRFVEIVDVFRLVDLLPDLVLLLAEEVDQRFFERRYLRDRQLVEVSGNV